MASMQKTPGVYIVEKDAFPNSVIEVATAVPAFIGYTEKADDNGTSLLNKPWRITSMPEFQSCFGAAPDTTFSIDPAAGAEPGLTLGANSYVLRQTSELYRFFHSMMLFFQNGGGACYMRIGWYIQRRH